jgi:type IV/VI secretion system ImpK/VasF family protein
MSAEPMSASLVRRLSLPDNQPVPQGYFRSKLFIVPFTTNPLVAAAGPIFSLLERLFASPTLPPVDSIRENIEHELRAFHSRLHGKTNTEETDALGSYLLSATIDEMIGKSYLRLYGTPAEFRAFTPLSFDGVGPEERFFDIVLYIKDRPNQYLDLIELAYYCLIAGFEGKQHQKADGRMMLDNLIEELFQLIQQHRVNKTHQLFRKHRKIDVRPDSYRRVILMSIICMGLLISGITASFTMLGNKAKSLQFDHAVFAKLDE